ncbi:PREDICTED: aluminum-activated malate transporter 13 [Camelina sativa]|uniref:Aluminum-activated malate transporter 13 n=1 Tax=Camelina sativa TaxID=90675 RepID=A0ABM0UIB4_CAMSA|nr:PREDICTED: aluminum-activated malate transporter 13 [Camelina sativa]
MRNKVEARSMEISMEKERCTSKRKKVLNFPKKMKKILKNLWIVGKEDPRRVIHALKVGIALTLVSLLYLMEPIFEGVGKNALWAVMTVVVVLEFSAGATLRKGLNRGLGTLVAGSLAFFIEWVAIHSGKILGGIFIGTAVFIIGSMITYMRFIPYIKKNYDYGMLVFLLTFNLITVSSYRVDTVIKIANARLYTIGIGIAICLFMSLLVFPIWSGDDLHKSTFTKLQGLSRCIEACVSEYFENKEKDKETSDSESDDEELIYKGYKTVLDSKSADEALAMYASWELRHTRLCHRFPSQQYMKVGSVLRKFSYTVVALHGCLQTEIQTPRSIRILFKDPCVRLAGEICKVLSELSESIRDRRHCSPEILSDSLEAALKDLNTTIKSQPKLFLGSNLHGDITNKHLNGDISYYNDTNSNDIVSYHNDNNSNGCVLGQTVEQNDTVSPLPLSVVSLSSLRSVKKSAAAIGEKRRLRKQLSKIAVMKSLEFSEALPFAAFASLLVEMVARLDTVIDEVEELGTIACFKEYDKTVEVRVEKPVDLVVGD